MSFQFRNSTSPLIHPALRGIRKRCSIGFRSRILLMLGIQLLQFHILFKRSLLWFWFYGISIALSLADFFLTLLLDPFHHRIIFFCLVLTELRTSKWIEYSLHVERSFWPIHPYAFSLSIPKSFSQSMHIIIDIFTQNIPDREKVFVSALEEELLERKVVWPHSFSSNTTLSISPDR